MTAISPGAIAFFLCSLGGEFRAQKPEQGHSRTPKKAALISAQQSISEMLLQVVAHPSNSQEEMQSELIFHFSEVSITQSFFNKHL